MVLLTMTKLMVEGLNRIQSRNGTIKIVACEEGNNLDPRQVIIQHGIDLQMHGQSEAADINDNWKSTLDIDRRFEAAKSVDLPAEPSLENPRLGNPISHGQVIDLSTEMSLAGLAPNNLEDFLQGARIYVPPPSPKKEPTSEYKALMVRLRREAELRDYQRMTNPPPPTETPTQKHSASSAAHAFSSNQPIGKSDEDDDEVTYADVDRQMALIFNVLISIVACAGSIWVVARWWSTPARLAISMGGSLLVGIAEVVVYSGYIRRVAESKGKAKRMEEVKEVINTWVIGGDTVKKDQEDPNVYVSGTNNLRRRQKER